LSACDSVERWNVAASHRLELAVVAVAPTDLNLGDVELIYSVQLGRMDCTNVGTGAVGGSCLVVRVVYCAST
jgi:hypothetical protein